MIQLYHFYPFVNFWSCRLRLVLIYQWYTLFHGNKWRGLAWLGDSTFVGSCSTPKHIPCLHFTSISLLFMHHIFLSSFLIWHQSQHHFLQLKFKPLKHREPKVPNFYNCIVALFFTCCNELLIYIYISSKQQIIANPSCKISYFTQKSNLDGVPFLQSWLSYLCDLYKGCGITANSILKN